jgi:U6 snRNA-associated Sm-like protein LSm6
MHVKDPADFLKQAMGKNVIVKLNSGLCYKGNQLDSCFPLLLFTFSGTLICLDGFMNIAMENSEEYFGSRKLSSFKNIFIRGNNGKNAQRKVESL